MERRIPDRRAVNALALVVALSGLFASCAKPGPRVELPMVAVPGGAFEYDGDSADIASVSPFKIGRYLVTGDQYKAVMGADPSGFTEPGHPVDGVSWFDAIAFCDKLSRAQGLKPAYSVLVKGREVDDPDDWVITTDIVAANMVRDDPKADGYRLPTEMEYMWAAMGASADSVAGDTVGGVDVGGFIKGYAGSDELSGGRDRMGEYAWTKEDSGETTHAVGRLKPNELGLYDMSGNVLEWCWDWYDSYPGGALADYRGASGPSPTFGAACCLRGGCCVFEASNCTVARRNFDVPYHPSSPSEPYGFRVTLR